MNQAEASAPKMLGYCFFPKVFKSTIEGRAISFQSPVLWNQFPPSVKLAPTVFRFKTRLIPEQISLLSSALSLRDSSVRHHCLPRGPIIEDYQTRWCSWRELLCHSKCLHKQRKDWNTPSITLSPLLASTLLADLFRWAPTVHRGYNHLKDLLLPSFHKVKPMVLIGSDHPLLITPRQPVRSGPIGGWWHSCVHHLGMSSAGTKQTFNSFQVKVVVFTYQFCPLRRATTTCTMASRHITILVCQKRLWGRQGCHRTAGQGECKS